MNYSLFFIIIYLLSSLIFTTINSSNSSIDSFSEFNNDTKILERNKRKYDLNERRKADSNFRTSEIDNNLNDDDFNQNDDYCIIGDVCGVGGGIAGDANIPCHIKSKPKTINDTEALDLLKTLCPSLFINQNNPAVCCSADQVREMEQNFANPKDLGMGKCPSCMQNFRTLHCEMTCSSRQSKFLQVVNHELIYDKEDVLKTIRSKLDDEEDNVTEKSIKLESKDDKSINKTDYLIIELNYFLDKEFVSTLYESCKNVKSLIGGQLIDVLCGAPPCNPIKWLKFMGTSYLRKGFSPIQINYFPIEDQTYLNLNELKIANKLDQNFNSNLSNLTIIQPMNIRAYQCYERINSELGACVCADCEKTCDVLKQNALPNPNYQQIRMLSAQNFTIFLSYLLFGMVAVGVFLYFLLEAIKKRRTYSHDFTKESIADKSKENLPYSTSMNSVYKIPDDNEDDDEKFIMNLGLKIEIELKEIFEKWGYFVATHPLKVLFISLFLSLSLAMGITKYKVTTDPVDLWVSSDSIARQDMEYFNQNFWKFYRIEQLILAPKNISNFTGTYSDENDDKISKQFSTLFKREILREAFELQISIEQLKIKNSKTGQMISLEDICYQPIPNKCAIQSLFTYFENNLNNLNDDNYLERISVCPENPTYFRTDMNCMEKNGIPLIYPEVALGGFPERNFAQSKALIITFPVNNYRESNLNENAIEFENAFLNHIQNYIKKTNLTSHFDITYKAEKSIEDELDRQSQSDVGTVVVSYVIMFIYILIALGEKDRGYLLLNTKCTVGFAGILVVILSVVSALGVFFFFNVPCTLIIVEVIPFLVLAVGIDNLFILVQTYYRDQRLPNEDLNTQFARICGEVFQKGKK